MGIRTTIKIIEMSSSSPLGRINKTINIKIFFNIMYFTTAFKLNTMMDAWRCNVMKCGILMIWWVFVFDVAPGIVDLYKFTLRLFLFRLSILNIQFHILTQSSICQSEFVLYHVFPENDFLSYLGSIDCVLLKSAHRFTVSPFHETSCLWVKNHF